MNIDKYIEIFKKTGALLEGHFVLTSGRHSSSYFQCAKVLQYPQYLSQFSKEIIKELSTELEVDKVISPAVGGIVLGTEVGRLLNKPTIFAERMNGHMSLRRGFKIKKGSKVIIIEDVITTGKSSMECVKLIKKSKAILVGFATIIDRSSKKTLKIKKRIISHLKIEVPTYKSNKIPKELDSIPISTPGSRFIK